MKQWLIGLSCVLMWMSTPANAQTNQFRVDKRYVHSMGTQTLLEIVRGLYPDQERYWTDITREFVRLNPHAFNATSQVLPGTRMLIPQHLPRVGRIATLSGNAWAVDFNGRKRTLGTSQDVYLGDRLITGTDSRVAVVAIDAAQFHLRPRTEFTFRTYRYRSDEPDTSIVQLLKGGLRTITGRIGNGRPQGYRLLTRIATIGVRGTEFGVRLCGSQECPVTPGQSVTVAPGLYVAVLQGEIAMRTRSTTQVVREGDFYYAAADGKAPQRLQEKPSLIFSDAEMLALRKPSPSLFAPVGSSKRASLSGEMLLLLLTMLVVARKRCT